MDLKLKNKVAIVTGSTGLCKSSAEALGIEGASVVITYLTKEDEKAAEDSIQKISKAGGNAISSFLDIRDINGIEKFILKVKDRFGKIDILVNCAGVDNAALAEDVTEEHWNKVVDTNLKGLFFCCKLVFNHVMKEQKSGRIINMASVVGVLPVKTNSIYSLTKAGVINITRSLAIEWGSYGIRVNSISPGWIDNYFEINQSRKDEWADPDSIIRTVPLGRYGKPQDIGNIVAFLASDKSGYVTGVNFIADGGISSGIRLAYLKDGRIEML